MGGLTEIKSWEWISAFIEQAIWNVFAVNIFSLKGIACSNFSYDAIGHKYESNCDDLPWKKYYNY